MSPSMRWPHWSPESDFPDEDPDDHDEDEQARLDWEDARAEAHELEHLPEIGYCASCGKEMEAGYYADGWHHPECFDAIEDRRRTSHGSAERFLGKAFTPHPAMGYDEDGTWAGDDPRG